MKQLILKNGVQVPRICLGCMRIASKDTKDVEKLLSAAMEEGITYFDHADIYGGGKSEEKFAEAAKNLGIPRDRIMIQTKCGIRKGMYDFSKEHIVNSVHDSLKRLRTDYADTLLLHRPDTLMEGEEVAAAFDTLEKEGSVRYFGVSNFDAGQMTYLQKYVNQPLLFNQLQFGPAHTEMIDEGINVNTRFDAAAVRSGGVLSYCRTEDVHIQAWSPFQFGMFKGVFFDSTRYEELTRCIEKTGEELLISREAVVAAWILRHPAGIQMIAGTTDADRLRQIAKGDGVTLSRAKWYEIYRAAGNTLP